MSLTSVLVYQSPLGDLSVREWSNKYALQIDAGEDYDTGAASLRFEDVVELRDALSTWIEQQEER
jgi:hypothetical protein